MLIASDELKVLGDEKIIRGKHGRQERTAFPHREPSVSGKLEQVGSPLGIASAMAMHRGQPPET